jgi:hypothetical protein
MFGEEGGVEISRWTEEVDFTNLVFRTSVCLSQYLYILISLDGNIELRSLTTERLLCLDDSPRCHRWMRILNADSGPLGH